MFSKTSFVFALLALFAVQSSSALYLDRVNERSVDDLVEKTYEAIKNFQEIAGGAIRNGYSAIYPIKDQFLANAYEIIYNVDGAIVDIVEKVQIQIKQIKEQAENLGDDVKECIAQNEAQLEPLSENINTKVFACTKNPAKQIEDKYFAIFKFFGTLLGYETQFYERLQECRASEEAVECIEKLIADIASKTTSVPPEVQASLKEYEEFGKSLRNDIVNCVLPKFTETSDEAAAIGVNVAKCIPSKIQA